MHSKQHKLMSTDDLIFILCKCRNNIQMDSNYKSVYNIDKIGTAISNTTKDSCSATV